MGPIWSAAALLFVASLFVPTGTAEAPPDAFCVVVIQPLDNFARVRVLVDEELNASARSDSWMAADTSGDGNITQFEAAQFRNETLQFWPSGAGMGEKSIWIHANEPYVQWEPIQPIYAATWRQLGHGFPGVSSGHGPVQYPVRATTNLETQAIRDYTFQTAGDPTHVWVRGGTAPGAEYGTDPRATYLPRAVIEYVVITAPAGWRIDNIQGFGYNGSFTMTDLDTAMQEIPGFDTSAPWSVRYVNAAAVQRHVEDTGIPSTRLVLLAFAILGAAALRRQPR